MHLMTGQASHFAFEERKGIELGRGACSFRRKIYGMMVLLIMVAVHA
jgi:hypothetical protein